MIETRKSIARPRSSALKRPSCGTRRSVMSSSASTLTRAIACSACAWSSISLICDRMPSMRNLMARPGGDASPGGCRSRRSSARRAASSAPGAPPRSSRRRSPSATGPRCRALVVARRRPPRRAPRRARAASPRGSPRKATRSPRCTRRQLNGSREALGGPRLPARRRTGRRWRAAARRRRRAAATQPCCEHSLNGTRSNAGASCAQLVHAQSLEHAEGGGERARRRRRARARGAPRARRPGAGAPPRRRRAPRRSRG